MSIAGDYVEKINELKLGDDPYYILNEYGPDKDVEQIESEIQEEHRWYNVVRFVYRCTDGSHFATLVERPASEIQEGQDPGVKPSAELVEPREVTVTRYFAIEAGAR